MELGNRRRHRLITALEQVNRMIGKEPKTVSVNLGFHREYPDWCHPSADLQTIQWQKADKYQQKKLKKAHRKRAAIESVIGHLKTDHRLGRNFYKGVVGDNINIMLAAADFNFKRMMNKWKSSFFVFIQNLIIQFNLWVLNCITRSKIAF
jgi:IS5 family transposase